MPSLQEWPHINGDHWSKQLFQREEAEGSKVVRQKKRSNIKIDGEKGRFADSVKGISQRDIQGISHSLYNAFYRSLILLNTPQTSADPLVLACRQKHPRNVWTSQKNGYRSLNRFCKGLAPWLKRGESKTETTCFPLNSYLWLQLNRAMEWGLDHFQLKNGSFST